MEANHVAWLQITVTAALNLGFAILIGLFAAQFCLSQAYSTWASVVRKQIALTAKIAVGMTLLASVLSLWFEAASMAEVPLFEASSAVRSMLESTHYGHAWLFGSLSLATAAVFTVAGRGGRNRQDMLLGSGIALALFALSRALVSHAVADGEMTWGVGVDWIHLMLISLWVGEVVVAALIVLRRTIADTEADRCLGAKYISALSQSATYALVGILVTGAMNAWRGLGVLTNVMATDYGTTLLIKLTLVAIAVCLGGLNRFFVMPGLLADLDQRGGVHEKVQKNFVRILKLETFVLVGVLIAAAILSATAPPSALSSGM